jgi:hypothetical protein
METERGAMPRRNAECLRIGFAAKKGSLTMRSFTKHLPASSACFSL